LRKYSGEAARALSPGALNERGLDESPIGRVRDPSPEAVLRGIESVFAQLFRKIGSPTPSAKRRPLTPLRTLSFFNFIDARKTAIEGGRQLFYAAFPTLTIAGFIALV